MRRFAIALVLSFGLLLATWVQAPAAPARDEVAPSSSEVVDADQSAQSTVPAARQVDEETQRLREHLAARAPFSEPVRNPFNFSAGKKPAPKGSEPFSTVSAEKGSDPLVLQPPASPDIAVPVLIGVTEDTVDGVVVRTAVLSMNDEMAIVKIGQPFARFSVKSIGPASVDLVDVTSPNRTVTTISIR